MTNSFNPRLLTFGSTIEYVPSESSSGEISVPHLGQENSPSPSIWAISSLNTAFSFTLITSFRVTSSFSYNVVITYFFLSVLPNLYQINTSTSPIIYKIKK
jgi:hypothetical protein